MMDLELIKLENDLRNLGVKSEITFSRCEGGEKTAFLTEEDQDALEAAATVIERMLS